MRWGSFVLALVFLVGTAFVLRAGLYNPQMHSWRQFSGLVAMFVTATESQALAAMLDDEIDSKWRAPDLTYWDTNLTEVLHARGTRGFVFNSSDLPAGSEYGTYNYCNMPHVRRTEYEKVPEQYRLEYVEVIHRHHKRTPYSSNLFPNEISLFDCSNTRLFQYGSSEDIQPVAASWTPLWTQQNPFKTAGQQSNCQFPQLTAEGFRDSVQHGKDLFDVYHDLLHLLPSVPNDQIKFRVTNNVITSQVAGAVVAGMYPGLPGKHETVSLLVEHAAIDSLEPTFPCPGASSLFKRYGVGSADPRWTTHLENSQSLRAALNAISGVDPADAEWSQSWDHYFDNLSSRQCAGLPLPRSVAGPSRGNKITQPQADEVYRLAQHEYAYLYRMSKQSLRYGVGKFGVWAAEFLAHVSDVKAGRETTKYFHNVAHDGSMSVLLAILQVDRMFWPGMGAELVFEVYSAVNTDHSSQLSGREWFIRILFGGQVFRSSTAEIGVADLIPLERFEQYIESLVGAQAMNVVALCKSGSS